ncbi:MAG: hypothetical protein AB7K71_02795 [Polyangiaceae bacterium]
MKSWLLWAWVLALVGLIGCGEAEDRAAPGAGGSAAGQAAEGGSAGNTSSGGAVAGGAGGDTFVETTECPRFCDYWDNQCGRAFAQCSCASKDAFCSTRGMACGCDGKLYVNQCEAQRSGVDIDASSACAAPPDSFACAGYFCALTDACVTRALYADAPPQILCEALPADCTGCGCFDSERCECSERPDGGLVVTCS